MTPPSRIIQAAEQQSDALGSYTLGESINALERTIDNAALDRLSSIYTMMLATIDDIRHQQSDSIAPECKPMLERAEKTLEELQSGGLQAGPIATKSFIAIYRSELPKENEGRVQRLIKDKQYKRSLEIQGLGCESAAVMALTLTMSDWSQRLQDAKFDYILGHLPKPGRECLPALLKILKAWENETFLRDCTAFKDSLRALHSSLDELTVRVPGTPPRTSLKDSVYAYSNVPFDKLGSVNDKLIDAMEHSRQYQMEKTSGATHSACVTVLIPFDDQQDGSINVRIQREAGYGLKKDLKLKPVNTE